MRSSQELNSLALEMRRLFGEDGNSPIDIFAIVNGCKEKKITIVRYPMSSRISGMCTRVEEDDVICINSAMSYGRQRFTLAHELYHIFYEDNKMQRVICGMNIGDNNADSEREADIFAGYLLVPYDALFQYGRRVGNWCLDAVIEAEQFFQISHLAMVYRLERDAFIGAQETDGFKKAVVSREAARLGYGKELYMPLPEERQYFTTGEYVRKVELLAENGLISNGRREELLMDAFRADIVYNMDEEERNPND